MDYVRLHTILLTHPKQERTPPRAWKALTLAWMYAGAHETNGRLPPECRRAIGLTKPIEEELISLGWMHTNGDGWVLHDWDDHQKDAAEIRANREKWREDKRRRRAEGKEN